MVLQWGLLEMIQKKEFVHRFSLSIYSTINHGKFCNKRLFHVVVVRRCSRVASVFGSRFPRNRILHSWTRKGHKFSSFMIESRETQDQHCHILQNSNDVEEHPHTALHRNIRNCKNSKSENGSVDVALGSVLCSQGISLSHRCLQGMIGNTAKVLER